MALLTIIMPAYNEQATIGELLRRVAEAPYDKQTIVVDDASRTRRPSRPRDLCLRRMPTTSKDRHMTTPAFTRGRDSETFAPFVLIDCRDTEANDVRLEFSDHAWIQANIGDDHIGDCYLNGYGIQGLVLAARLAAGLPPLPAGFQPDSEADTCFLHFSDLDTAVETARLAQDMLHDPAKRDLCAKLAAEEGFGDL